VYSSPSPPTSPNKQFKIDFPDLFDGLGKIGLPGKRGKRSYGYTPSFYVSFGGFNAPRSGKGILGRFSGFETRGRRG
jgi:hypothetical protein